MKKKKPKDEKGEFSKKLALIEESLSRFQHVVPIETVIPYQSNPRDNSAAVEKVAESLLECGWCNSIAVESLKNPVIAAGHTRLQAALKIGLKRVPVQPLDHLPPEKIRLYRILDNRTSEFSTWKADLLKQEIDALTAANFDMVKFGFSDADLNAILADQDPISSGKTDPEKIPVLLGGGDRSQPGKIYQLGRHILICGDATNAATVAKVTGGNPVDLWITDPPYNVDYSGKNEMLNRSRKGNSNQTPIENDAMTDAAFQDFLNKSFAAATAAMKPGAVFYIFHADLNGIFFREAVRNCGLHLKQVLQWIKNNIVIGRNDYQWIHEPCLYGWRDGGPHFFSGDRKQRTVIELDKAPFRKREDGRFEFRIGAKIFTIAPDAVVEEEATTGLEFPKPQTSAEHPTMKPVALFIYLIRNSTRRGETILDTFAGSGTAILAAEQTDRRAVCVELEPRYCDVIRKRWAEFVYGEGCAWENLTPEV
ncbi:MAG: DNA modification methylase [Alphaproteobacteria bacterium]|nr:DNA modification methylase [Alphaproteobacteria bacterium]